MPLRRAFGFCFNRVMAPAAESNAELVDRLVLRERAALRETVTAFAREVTEAREVLGAVCHLLNARQRYFGAAGEYFSVQDLDGMEVVDRLDEILLFGIGEVLNAWLESARPAVSAPVRRHLLERYHDLIENLPREYPVGYMVLFVIRRAFELFDPIARQRDPEILAGFESGFTEFLGELVRRYVRSRTTPVLRHYSDLQRERSVVARLRCRCGREKYAIERYEAAAGEPGSTVGRMELRCGACGFERTLQFVQPHAADLAAIRNGQPPPAAS